MITRVAVEERRHVTALFADLVASTSLSDRLDPEVVRGVVSRYFERAAAEIRGFGGSVEKFSGDAVMAVFGLQQAHEDDPERAVRAAFAVLQALADLAPKAAERHGIVLQARIGIESGEVVTGDPFGGSTMATGDVLNLAARLEEQAAPGHVMVGPVVHEATASAVTYESAGTHDIKGKAEPVAIWRAIDVRVEPGVTIRGITGHTAPLTGRDEELQLLREAARRSRNEQKAILFTILGLPGVGKSRLVRELGDELQTDDWHILRGRCLPYGEGITYWPLGEIVRGLSGVTAELSSVEALARIRAAAPDDETAERLAFAIGALDVPAARKVHAVATPLLGGAAVYRASVHIAVEALLNAVGPRVKRAMLRGVDACMAATALFMLGYGAHLCIITQYQSMAEFPGLSVGIVYAPIPLAGLFTLLFVVERVWLGSPPKTSVMYSDQAVELE